MKSKKAMELPINIIVMLIIGLVIFSLGMGLFSKIAGSSEDQVKELEDRVKTGIASLECDGEDWICVPKVNARNGKSQSFSLYVANRGTDPEDFSVSISDGGDITKTDCGSIEVIPYIQPVNIRPKESAQIPFIVNSNAVTKTPCSFIGTFTLTGAPETEKATLIVAVE